MPSRSITSSTGIRMAAACGTVTANAIIGTDVVAKAEGDGSVLLMVDRLAVVTNPLLYSKLPYDWQQDLKPVTDLALGEKSYENTTHPVDHCRALLCRFARPCRDGDCAPRQPGDSAFDGRHLGLGADYCE